MFERPLVLATKNKGKVAEFEDLLAGFPVKIMSLHDFGTIPAIEEDGETFEENAYKKAHLTAKILGVPALADDSGLVVEALGGAPGVRSARYAGENATDEENNLKLLKHMEGKSNRKAFFETAICLAVPAGPALTYQGICEGEITREMIGAKGFGYDPVFYYPPLNRTFAQLSPGEKNVVSHRGRAMSNLRDEFDKVIVWLTQRLADGDLGKMASES